MYGPGVEKIFDEVKEIFPLYKASIFSSDYLKTKERTNNLFKIFICLYFLFLMLLYVSIEGTDETRCTGIFSK